MGKKFKVNFNNLKIKLPYFNSPIINRLSLSEMSIINPNTYFDTSKILIYINGNYLLSSDTFKYVLTLPEEITNNPEDNKTFTLTIILQNAVSKFTKEQRFDFTLDMYKTCSDYMVCSEKQTVSEY
jgi:hypothetical protein